VQQLAAVCRIKPLCRLRCCALLFCGYGRAGARQITPHRNRQRFLQQNRHKADRHRAEDRRFFYHPCFATRLGGVSGGKETQGWRDSSHTAMVGTGKFGSAKLPMATATYPGKPSLSQ
jgi:hypothetical protein